MDFITFGWFGLVAGLILFFGILTSSRNFCGMKKESFSFFNHFISELGDPRFAPHKTLFSLSLIIGGLCMIPFAMGIGLYFKSFLGDLIYILGIFCAVFCSLIGFIPEHKVKAHFIIAGIFFVGMDVIMLLFSLAIFFQPADFPSWFVYFTFSLFLIFSIFNFDTIRISERDLHLTDMPWVAENDRPKFWLNPFLEWLAFFAILLWIILTATIFI